MRAEAIERYWTFFYSVPCVPAVCPLAVPGVQAYMVVVPGGEKGCPWQAEVRAGMEGPLPRSSAPAISTEHSHDLRLIFRDTSIRRAWSVLEIEDRRCDEALPLALNPIA